MPVVTAAEVVQYSSISATAATITASGLIPVVQQNINLIKNNYFTTDLRIRAGATFNASAMTIVLDANNWVDFGFHDGDEIYICESYRNNGYVTIDTFSGSTANVATSSTIVNEELTSAISVRPRFIEFSVVSWPLVVKRAAALMVAYDYDVRPTVDVGLKSQSLGPWSETYADRIRGNGNYPEDLIASLPVPIVDMI